MKLSNEDLVNLPKYAMDFNGKGGVIVNKGILKSICNELIELRNNNILIALKLEDIKNGTTDEFTYNDLNEFIENIDR